MEVVKSSRPLEKTRRRGWLKWNYHTTPPGKIIQQQLLLLVHEGVGCGQKFHVFREEF